MEKLELQEEEKEPTLKELGEALKRQEIAIKELNNRLDQIERKERFIDPSGVLLTGEETKKIKEEGQSLH